MSTIKIKIENTTIESANIKELNSNVKEYGILVSKHVHLGNNVTLSKGVTIGVGCKIADGVVINKNASVADECIIGENSIIGEGVIIETGVVVGKNVIIEDDLIVGEEAVIDDSVLLKDTFYKKTIKSNITYCGNGKASIGCQLFKIDFWIKNYQKVADKFDYTQQEIEECLIHMKHIKNNI
mgnify:CR=1 FL=1